jgi:hypothetical protein
MLLIAGSAFMQRAEALDACHCYMTDTLCNPTLDAKGNPVLDKDGKEIPDPDCVLSRFSKEHDKLFIIEPCNSDEKGYNKDARICGVHLTFGGFISSPCGRNNVSVECQNP